MASKEFATHDWFLGALWQIPSIETVKLVSRIHDDRIGNADTNSILIFFADMHLISRNKIGRRYKYGFNHERMFVQLARKLRSLRKNDIGYKPCVFQLGDFVDLWKEDTTDPFPILSEYQGVRDYLYGLKGLRSAGCKFALGNHDADLARIPHLTSKWHYRMFLPQAEPRVYATHGDVFDWIESLPDSLQKWAVYHFSPKEKKPHSGLEDLIELRRHYSIPVDPTLISQIGTPGAVSLTGLGSRVNIQNNHKFLDKCRERVGRMNREHNLKINAAVIGHTHNAQMSVADDGNNLFVLMDCGAWYGSYADSDGTVRANAQIGVICGNDFRIYQLDADTQISPQFEKTKVL
jgi:UDP-2,3-diacylglucosamine pyrophosphatase LpxH